MANLFCADEAIEMGIQIKKNGKDFYAKVARSSKTKRVKELFRWLASEEVKHIKIFEYMLAGIQKCVRQEIYPGGYSAYLSAMIDDHLFGKKKDQKKMMLRVGNNGKAIDLAIDFEKDSLLLYHEMKNFVRRQERKLVTKLIRQQQEHIRKLSALKECLSSSELKVCLVRR